MAHPDPFDLASMLAGGAVPDDMRDHVRDCPRCQADLADLRAAMDAPRAGDLPSADVWAGIHRSLQLPARLAADPLSDVDPAVARRVDDASSVRTLRREGRRRAGMIALSAAAAVVIAIAGVLVGIRIAAPPPAPRSNTLADATLTPFPGWSKTGQAKLVETIDGDRYLTVSLEDTVPDGDVREVWLMRSDLKALISLGLLEGSSGTFAVPGDLDLSQYDVVDVSAEPLDGNPAHSGNSIVRGTLRTA
jgi:anti-sigma-K factor RskA